MIGVKIRSYKPLDEDFIYHSWLSSIDYNVPGIRAAVRDVIDMCVQDVTIMVSTPEDDDDHILGWLAYHGGGESKSLLYVFVKKHLRNHGIGGELVKEVFKDLSPIPTVFWSFWAQKYNLKNKWKLKYNSLLLPALVHSYGKKKQSKPVERSKGERATIGAQA
mgnify:CR=1 FL=1|jgi:GNAT superfamily N-acetyltransferase|tara:strand:+ start:1056 stop:1544 length:489 start_codon:yes stop_codon:yes gene_type:complete